MNNLYIITLTEIIPVVISAPSLERCKEIFVEEFGKSQTGEFDSAIGNGNYKVIENACHTEGVISYVWGGGMPGMPVIKLV